MIKEFQQAFDAFAAIEPNMVTLEETDSRDSATIHKARQLARNNITNAKESRMGHVFLEFKEDADADTYISRTLAEHRKRFADATVEGGFDQSLYDALSSFIGAETQRQEHYADIFEAFHVHEALGASSVADDVSPMKMKEVDDVRSAMLQTQAAVDADECCTSRLRPLCSSTCALRDKGQRLSLQSASLDVRDIYEGLCCDDDTTRVSEEIDEELALLAAMVPVQVSEEMEFVTTENAALHEAISCAPLRTLKISAGDEVQVAIRAEKPEQQDKAKNLHAAVLGGFTEVKRQFAEGRAAWILCRMIAF